MPFCVVLAIVLQLLLAGMFVVMLGAYRSAGPRAQRAAEEATARQGVAPQILAEHGIRLEEGRGGFVVGYLIAAVLTALAILNLTGNELGRLLSWVVQPLVFLGVGYVTTIQVFAVPMTVSVFARLDDPRVQGLDIRAVLHAAVDVLPSWYRPATVLRWLLATAGSVAVIILLALPAAGSYFS
ncbi:hypothetical protein [Nocardia brasiliensis]|uniref:Uncharacterized protein n=1 Tax=Nocardia brasiliensis (strain ATCC 700358 / HUJEG-1) TaxID=1133849 RepID=K0ER57_NOCB7|nr:hypothetical protein [Nocardia brasiliensis]AFT99513.1 hypothetical protein O3I_007755 [Nocardia brasiliensis ATCC 700358]OCF90466.1 hypothetical protein AW168_10870 [Nocardia brasiliensis]